MTTEKTTTSAALWKPAVMLGIAVLVWAVFGQTYHFGFVRLDDNTYVTQNPNLQAGLTATGVRWAFTTTYADFWHPLTWLSFLLDWRLFGLNPGGYHLTNVIWHLLASLLLFALFCRMTGRLWRSAFVAAFFALHPLHVESVAWISERKDVLSAFFWMLTLYLYVRYTEKPSLKRYLPVVFCFVCGLLSKPMVITLPLVMVLLDFWPLKRLEFNAESLKFQLKEKLPLLALSAVFSVITVFAQYHAGGRDLQFPLSLRTANALTSLIVYLQKTFWPTGLGAFYPFPQQIPALKITAAAALILLITAVAAAAAKRLPFLFVGWFWFGITLLPVIGLLPIGDFAMADRFHYLPSIGLSVILAWGAPLTVKSDKTAKIFLFALAGVFLSALAVLSYRQTGFWKNDIALFSHTLQVTRNNYLAHLNLGATLAAEGRPREAIAHYNETIRIMPNLAPAYTNRAIALAEIGRYPEAFNDLNRIIRLKPDYAAAYLSRGILYHRLGQESQAIEEFNKAIRLKPDDSAGYFNRGNSLIRLERLPEALEDFQRAVSLNPTEAVLYNNRGFVYLRMGLLNQALEDYSRAISLKPDYADAFNNRAFVRLVGQNVAAGCADAAKACALGNCKTLELAKNKGLCR
jgi:tetratricopeptide (TPR) repeat protein